MTVTPSPPSRGGASLAVAATGLPDTCSRTARRNAPVPLPWMTRSSLIPLSSARSIAASTSPLTSAARSPRTLISLGTAPVGSATRLAGALGSGAATRRTDVVGTRVRTLPARTSISLSCTAVTSATAEKFSSSTRSPTAGGRESTAGSCREDCSGESSPTVSLRRRSRSAERR